MANSKKEIAQVLYINHGVPQNEIAKTLDISEKTVSNWSVKGRWSELRNSSNISISQTKNNLFTYVKNMENAINKRPEELRFPTSQEADALKKILSTIKDLDNNLSIAQACEFMKTFLQCVKNELPEHFEIFTKGGDLFLQLIAKKHENSR